MTSAALPKCSIAIDRVRVQPHKQLLLRYAGEISEAYPLMDEVARSEGWDDPEMDIYNQFREPNELVPSK